LQPSLANSAATVLLPDAMPPNIPITGFLPIFSTSGSLTAWCLPVKYLGYQWIQRSWLVYVLYASIRTWV
ncbi:MAG: hypothetical protein U9Q07_07745, partial [Planctomycetota bacterium]|nr:hypothetical protein [Planctomycetota bacterium]